MPRKPMADKGIQTSLRLPSDLYERLTKAAGDKGIGEEIRWRLEASFAEKPADPRFADLLDTIAYAASAAGRTYPASKVIASQAVARRMFPGERIEPHGREVEDITAHWLLEACLQMLLDAFRPNGLPASLPKDHVAMNTELLRRADRIVGAALGTLGERGLDAFNRLAPIDQERVAGSGPTGQRLADKAAKYFDEEEEENKP